jgi:hypothetical protein
MVIVMGWFNENEKEALDWPHSVPSMTTVPKREGVTSGRTIEQSPHFPSDSEHASLSNQAFQIGRVGFSHSHGAPAVLQINQPPRRRVS